MNHTSAMETPTITTETLSELQNKIAASLQSKALVAINQGTQYRRELEAVGFSIELSGRLKCLIKESDGEERGMAVMNRY